MARSPLVAFLVLLPACSACSEPGNGSRRPEADATTDVVAEASVSDASPDLPEAAPGDSGASADVVDGALAVPTWSLLPGDAAGCPVERLTNPEQVRLFSWVPCEGVSNCERAVITEGVLPYGPEYQAWAPACSVSDQSGVVRLGMVQAGMGETFFALEDGTVFDGFRPAPGHECTTGGAAIWGDRYGVPILAYPDGGTRAGGVLHTVGDTAQPGLFTLPSLPGGPQATWMGSDRWAWWWVLPERLVSISAKDGGDVATFAPTNPSTGPVVALGRATTAGPLFLFEERVVPEAGAYTTRIAASDGKQPSTPYLTPTDDSHYGAIAFSGSHVGWMRGVSPKGGNEFDHVEVWGSPYSPDPSALEPEKIGEYPLPHISASSHTGGHGKYAVSYAVQQNPTLVQELVWDLKSKTKTTFHLPEDVIAKWPMGITSEFLWVVGGPRKSGDTTWLMRFRIDA